MSRTLMILEVSKKQDFIFSSQKLQENVVRSNIIRHVTGSSFFSRVCPEYYSAKNMVYSGGGHTVLQFDSEITAREFAEAVTEAAMREYQGLELFVKLLPYEERRTPGENLKALSAALERKKALRCHSFQRMTFGVDQAPEGMTFRDPGGTLMPLEGWRFPSVFSDLLKTKTSSDNANFIAVVHIDGNAMGQRVQNIYDANTGSWEACCQALARFSEGIQSDFEGAFSSMVQEVIAQSDHLDLAAPTLPIRPVILAGDDVCFACRGDIGLECARVFMEKLALLVNTQDHQSYACCAGVALVHEKYPFHRAYALAEALCSNAKRFGAEVDRRISAMDWHIEFGQLKDSLTNIRRDYETEDHNRMELRPLAVLVPEDIPITEALQIRSYGFYREMLHGVQEKRKNDHIVRSKLKALRNAIKQGRLETAYFLEDKEIGDLVHYCFNAQFRSANEKRQQIQKMLAGQAEAIHDSFMDFGDTRRCLLFDAIEMMDHDTAFREGDS